MKQSISLFIGIILFITSVPAYAVTHNFNNPEDSYVRQSSPATNYGSENVLIADGVSQDPNNGTYGEVAAVIQWDLSTIIPSDATVTGVSVTLNLTDSSTGPYNIYSQNSSWSENTVDWNSFDPGSQILGTIPPFTIGFATIVLNADAVALVQSWVDGSNPNGGFAIRTGGTNNGIQMNSNESGGTPPTLEVTYTTSGEPTLQSLQAEINRLNALLAGVTRNNNNIRFSGVNVQIDNGLGATNGNPEQPDESVDTFVNGLGNLIVGYNEEIRPYRGDTPVSNKTGSHNVIVGHGHNYTSYGGLVVGRDSIISGPYASVSGGAQNIASAPLSSVSGGFVNEANGNSSSVSGGHQNIANEAGSSVSGGSGNIAGGRWSSVSGGFTNTANGGLSSVSGGQFNNASGALSSISGGRENTASEFFSSVQGGRQNTASGNTSSVSGGNNRTAAGTYDWVAGSLFEDQ